MDIAVGDGFAEYDGDCSVYIYVCFEVDGIGADYTDISSALDVVVLIDIAICGYEVHAAAECSY